MIAAKLSSTEDIEAVRRAIEHYIKHKGHGAIELLLQETGLSRSPFGKFRRGIGKIGFDFGLRLIRFLQSEGYSYWDYIAPPESDIVQVPARSDLFELISECFDLERQELMQQLYEIYRDVKSIRNRAGRLMIDYQAIRETVQTAIKSAEEIQNESVRGEIPSDEEERGDLPGRRVLGKTPQIPATDQSGHKRPRRGKGSSSKIRK